MRLLETILLQAILLIICFNIFENKRYSVIMMFIIFAWSFIKYLNDENGL